MNIVPRPNVYTERPQMTQILQITQSVVRMSHSSSRRNLRNRRNLRMFGQTSFRQRGVQRIVNLYMTRDTSLNYSWIRMGRHDTA